jgi:type II secretory pathway component GspD/PulD (secretin)
MAIRSWRQVDWYIWAAVELCLLVGPVSPLWAQAYCNITGMDISELSNGVQISVRADGRLEYQDRGAGDGGTTLTYAFNNARLQLDDTFWQLDRHPVSYVQFAVSPQATQGIGVTMTVKLVERAQVRTSISPDLQTFVITTMTRTTAMPSNSSERGGGRGADRGRPGRPGASAAPPLSTGAATTRRLEEGRVSVECSKEGLMTVRAVGADIHEVVARIARAGGINAAVNDSVKRNVSLNVVDTPPQVLLQGLAAGYGLALSRVGDVEMLSEGVLKERDLATYNRSATSSFPITYLEASEAASLLPNFLISYLNVNSEQNAVVVTAPSQMLAKIESDLRAVDVAPPVIMVEAMVVELSDTGKLYENLAGHYRSFHHEAKLDAAGGDVLYRDLEPLEGGTGIAETAQLTANLSALISKGVARIRAKPRMAAVNGKRAEIFIGAQRFIRVTYLVYGQEQERIQGVPVGVRLQVVPWTGGNEEITTQIDVEVSNIRSLDPETGLPLLSSRRATSTVRTCDGETIIIGGLQQQQTETTKSKIPILGDLPIIGGLFRSTSTSDVNTELVILLTPKILDSRGRQSEEVEREVRSQFLLESDLGYMPLEPEE